MHFIHYCLFFLPLIIELDDHNLNFQTAERGYLEISIDDTFNKRETYHPYIIHDETGLLFNTVSAKWLLEN